MLLRGLSAHVLAVLVLWEVWKAALSAVPVLVGWNMINCSLVLVGHEVSAQLVLAGRGACYANIGMGGSCFWEQR